MVAVFYGVIGLVVLKKYGEENELVDVLFNRVLGLVVRGRKLKKKNRRCCLFHEIMRFKLS